MSNSAQRFWLGLTEPEINATVACQCVGLSFQPFPCLIQQSPRDVLKSNQEARLNSMPTTYDSVNANKRV